MAEFVREPMPEHDKIYGAEGTTGDRRDEHEHIVDFLNWLEEQDYQVIRHEYEMAVYYTPRALIAEYFGINMVVWKAEEEAMIKALREFTGGA